MLIRSISDMEGWEGIEYQHGGKQVKTIAIPNLMVKLRHFGRDGSMAYNRLYKLKGTLRKEDRHEYFGSKRTRKSSIQRF
jgi:hypothetical protein